MPDNGSNSNDAKVVDTSPRPVLAALVGFVVISLGFLIVMCLNASKEMFASEWVYEPELFATSTDAVASQGCPIPLPAQAVNVRIAMWRHFIGVCDYVRFEAPVDVCLAHAATIVAGQELMPIEKKKLLREEADPESKVFRDVSWFDLPSAKNVVGAGGGSHHPTVWVDQERGVFYYRLTD